MAEDFVKDMYNKFTDLPTLSYNCIAYLIENNEIIWHLLKYNDRDCWKTDATHPDLTKAEKGALIYAGQSDDTNYRIFQDVGYDSAWNQQCCFLRITPIELFPINHIIGKVTIGFEIYAHYKINTLSNYQTRLNMMSQQIIETFNGAEILGMGRLFFDARTSSRCKMQIIGSIPYKGNAVFMTNYI